MNRFKDNKLILNLILLLILSACSGPEPEEEIPPTPPPVTPPATSTPIPSPTPWPTATTEPTATNTPTPTETPDATATYVAENTVELDIEFNFQGVFLNFSEKLYSELVPGREAARFGGYRNLNYDAPVLDGVPDHIVLRGKNEVGDRETLIGVQSIVDGTGFFYPSYDIKEQEYFNELRRVSITRPSLEFFFEADEFVLDPQYIDFKNGKGVSSIRYIPSTDGPEEITNQELYYTFEGISNSGFFYVWLQYPVRVDALPDQKSFTENQLEVLSSDASTFSIYKLNEMEQVRRSLENSELAPLRSVLDELSRTLFISDTAGGTIAVAEDSGSDSGQEQQIVQDQQGQGEGESEIPAVDPTVSGEEDETDEDGADVELPTETPEPTETSTPEPEPTETSEPTETPSPTETTVPTETPTPEPEATATPEPTETPEPTATLEPTATPEPEEEPTATAEAPTETPTVEPTVTPAPTEPATATPTEVADSGPGGPVPTYDPACNNFLNYLEDVTIPDFSEVEGGAEFEKTWRVENRGSCPITSEFEVLVTGDAEVEFVRALPIETIEAGGEGLLTIVLRAPNEAGTYESNAKLVAPNGQQFGQLFTIFVVR